REAEALASESLEANGTAALALSLSKATESLLASPEIVAAIAPDNCRETYVGMLHLSRSPFDLTYYETLNELGWDAQFDLIMTLKQGDEIELPGSYTMAALDAESCSWGPAGIEQMDSDG